MEFVSPKKKLRQLKILTPLKTKKSLQRIYGFFNWWKRFIPKFSQKTYHMRKLLRLDEPFLWDESTMSDAYGGVQKFIDA